MASVIRYRIKAFLSYRHGGQDGKFGSRLHKELESYRIPKDLVGRETPSGKVPRDLRPIFKDREDFVAGQSLHKQTAQALQESEYLLVVCSPRAAESAYINAEIDEFVRLHGPDRVVPIILEGEPNNVGRDPFPKKLRELVPGFVAADARSEGDDYDLAKLKVIARLIEVPLDDLRKREAIEAISRARIAGIRWAVLSVLFLAAGFFGWQYWISQKQIAEVASNVEKRASVAVLQAAVAKRDGSDQGQSAAIADMIARGNTFNNSDLSGLSLRGARLAKGSFGGAVLVMADFEKSDSRQSDFSRARMHFARLDNSSFANANFNRADLSFATGRGTKLGGIDGTRALLFACDFRGADFTGAKLTGATFSFCDLRDAKFTRADLSGASFAGAFLHGADFSGATISDTDFLGAVINGNEISPEQTDGACRRVDDLHDGAMRVEAVRKLGDRYDNMIGKFYWFTRFRDRSLKLCTWKADYHPFAYTKVFLEQSYLQHAGRLQSTRQYLEEHAPLKDDSWKGQLVKSDGSFLDELTKLLERNATDVNPKAEPYLNTDQLILLLLQAGAVSEIEVNWSGAASQRYNIEVIARDKKVVWGASEMPLRVHGAVSMWADFFPPRTPFGELPKARVEAYRKWSMARVARTPMRLVHRPTFSCSSVGPKVDPVKVSVIDAGCYRMTVENYGVVTWGGVVDAIKARGISHTQIFAPSVRADLVRRRYVLMAFPKDPKGYYALIPVNVWGGDVHEDGHRLGRDIEVDIMVEGVEKVGEDTILIRAVPGAFYMTQDGKRSWQSPVKHVTD